MFTIFLLYFFFATMFTFGKSAVLLSQPIFFISFRMFIAGFLLILYMSKDYNKLKAICISRFTLFKVVLFIMFHIYIPYIFEFIALTYISSSRACILFSLSPLLNALFSFILFKDLLSKLKWVGLFIGICGLSIIIIFTETQFFCNFYFISISDFFLFISVSSSVLGWILFKELLIKYKYSPLQINGFSMLLGSFFCLFTSVILESSPKIHILNYLLYERISFLKILIFVVFIANILCYNLYGRLLKIYSTTFLSFSGFLCPIFTVILGYFYLEESVSFYFFVALGIIMFGLYIFYLEETQIKKD